MSNQAHTDEQGKHGEDHGHGGGNIRFGMVIDLDKCTACGACALACQQENNVPFRPDESDKKRTIQWLQYFYLENEEEYPNHKFSYMPRPCFHCDSPHHSPCTFVCPANATVRDEHTGIVDHIPVRCIGCRYCMVACPYHARTFNWWDPQWPGEMEQMLNPNVSCRMRGVVEKCTFCRHRYNLARDQKRQEGEDPDTATYTTACAQACPAGAIKFGNLRDPHSEVHELIKSDRAFRVGTKLKTEPKVYYLSKHLWIRKLAEKSL